MPLVSTSIAGQGDGLQVLPAGRRKKKHGVFSSSLLFLIPLFFPCSQRLPDTFSVYKRPHGNIPMFQQSLWDDSMGCGEKNLITHAKLFLHEGSGETADGTCLDSCTRPGHSSPSTNADTHISACAAAHLNTTAHLNKYTDTKYWVGLLTRPLPPTNMCTHT